MFASQRASLDEGPGQGEAHDVTRFDKITVLIPGRLHDHAVARMAAAFNLIRVERADAALLSREDRERIRAITTFGAVDAAFIDAVPNLEIIANFGVGYDRIDAAHAGQAGVMVTNTPDVLTEEVADTAIGLLLNTLREFPKAEAWLRAGKWQDVGPYRLTPGTLRGRTIGIFGMGRIGLAIARRLEGFGVSLAYHNRNQVEGVAYPYHPSLLTLARNVDTLICAAPGGDATRRAINAEVLAALGPQGVFINIGRGSSVDEDALATALRDQTIFAAGLDVFADEPRIPEQLLQAPNACLLPHVASASQHTRKAMADLVVDNLESWFSGKGALTPVPETCHLAASINHQGSPG